MRTFLFLFTLAVSQLPAEIVAIPPSTFCGDTPVFCYGEPGQCKGLVDNKGRIVREFQRPFEIFGPYSEGLLAVRHPNSGLVGYLDEKGRWAIKPQWKTAGAFHSGLAKFCVAPPSNDKVNQTSRERSSCGFIDKEGRVAIEPRFDALENQVDDFDDQGFARFYVGAAYDDPARRVGLIDRDGKVVIEPYLFALGEFQHGVAAAVFEGPCWQEKLYAFDSSDYFELYPHVFADYYKHMDEGDESGIPHCRWRLIDPSGKPVDGREYLDIAAFSEGLAAARSENGWVYIDPSGSVRIPLMSPVLGGPWLYSHFRPRAFSEGLAAVCFKDDCWSYINPQGRVQINEVLDGMHSVGPFREGLAVVRSLEYDEDRRVRYIGRSGETAIDEAFLNAADFCHGVAQVSRKSDDGFHHEAIIDTAGKTLFSWVWHW